jgi:hypothetical protein
VKPEILKNVSLTLARSRRPSLTTEVLLSTVGSAVWTMERETCGRREAFWRGQQKLCTALFRSLLEDSVTSSLRKINHLQYTNIFSGLFDFCSTKSDHWGLRAAADTADVRGNPQTFIAVHP